MIKIPIVKNTLTNYLSMGVKLLQGVLVTRWLIAYLGEEYYGLWALLWSFFCYSLLLDFGFGVTAQKYTSIGIFQQDLKRYNRIISTIFSFHAVMSLIILACTVAASFFVVTLFHLDDTPAERIEYCRRCFLLFGIGSALIFPSGIFPEIMVGLHKIYQRNYVIIVSKLLELAGLLLVFACKGELLLLISFTLVLNLLTNLAMLFYIRPAIPGFRLRLWISREVFREIFQFSGFVYLCSVARLLWGRISPLLISIFCGLQEVGFFQIGSRLPNLMNQLTGPYQENITPISASFYAQGKHRALSRILVNSMRWNSFLSSGMMVGIFVFAAELIRFLFKVDQPLVLAICQLMVVSLYIGLLFRSIPERFLLMAEKHKLLSWITIWESVANFAACIVLLQFFNITCVVWAALIIKVFTTVFFIAPPMLRYLKIGVWKLLYEICFRQLAAALPLVGIALLLETFAAGSLSDFWLLVIGGSSGGLAYVGCSYWWVLSADEKRFFRRKYLTRWRQAWRQWKGGRR